MSAACDEAFKECVNAAKDVEAAEATNEGTKADLLQATKAFQSFLSTKKTAPVAGDKEFDDLQKAKITDSGANRNLSDARLEVMKKSQKL